MHQTKRLVFAIATIALVLGMASMSEAAQASQAPAPVAGDLVSVDTEAKTITVRAADGQSMQFQYTDETKVSGAQQNVAGLATAKNVRVTVTFREQGKARIATQIDVEAPKQ